MYATSLNKYFRCHKVWLYEEVLRLKKPEAEATLLDDDSKGIIYHDILNSFFSTISCFKKEDIVNYRTAIKKLTADYFCNPKNYESALIEPFKEPLIRQTNKLLTRYLDAEIAYFDKYSVAATETKITYAMKDLILTGKIDRVSISPDSEIAIIDYKTATTPTITSCKANKNGKGPNGQAFLEDFQMAMYVKLYEHLKSKEVTKGIFMNLMERKSVVIFPKILRDPKKPSFTRKEYQETLDTLDIYIDAFQDGVLAMDFGTEYVEHKKCIQCPYQNICRSCFMLNLMEYEND
ncbi:MAG: hypothetical protein Ta2F_18420 [Termitinemataceae bacterium]|nr:MAG: hypothetical protein Ta2F_18420 [Termitinemataceae bacterium]